MKKLTFASLACVMILLCCGCLAACRPEGLKIEDVIGTYYLNEIDAISGKPFNNRQKYVELKQDGTCVYAYDQSEDQGTFEIDGFKVKLTIGALEYNCGVRGGIMYLSEKDEYYCQNGINTPYVETDELKFAIGKDGYYMVVDAQDATTLQIEIPETINDVKVTSLKKSVFGDCTNLRRVIIPASVTFFGEDAFANLFRIEEVRYGGTISQWCQIEFENAKANPLYDISETNTKPNMDGADLYIDGKVTKQIEIDKKIEKINSYAFVGANLESVTIPSTLKEVGDSAFACRTLDAVYYNGSVAEWLNLYLGELDSNPLSLGCDLYFNNELFTEWTVPESIKTIKASAFYGCTSLKSLTIPNHVEKIGHAAFGNCELDKLVIGDALTSDIVEEGAQPFYYSSIHNAELPVAIWETCKDTTYYDGFQTVKFTTGDEIPASAFATAGVNMAFINLESVEFPDAVKKIGESAFNGCSALKSIKIPEGITEIPRMAFSNCGSLAEITFPSSLEKIGDMAFQGCSKLDKVVFPEGMTTLGYAAFYNCDLKDISFPASLVNYGTYVDDGTVSQLDVTVFAYNCHVQKITVAAGNPVLKVDGGCLVYNETDIIGNDGEDKWILSLTIESGFTIPDYVDTIGELSLARAEYEYLIIPSGVQMFDDYICAGSKIKDVYFLGSWGEWQNLVGRSASKQAWNYECPNKITLHCQVDPHDDSGKTQETEKITLNGKEYEFLKETHDVSYVASAA